MKLKATLLTIISLLLFTGAYSYRKSNGPGIITAKNDRGEWVIIFPDNNRQTDTTIHNDKHGKKHVDNKSRDVPMYKYGEDALNVFISSNINYPQAAKNRKIQGKVYVNFKVGANGELTNFKVIYGLGYGCDEEAIRVIKSTSPWQPAIHNDKAVEYNVTMTVKFILPENQ